MLTKKIKILSRRHPWDFGVQVLILNEDSNGNQFVGKYVFEKVEPGSSFEHESISVRPTEAQLLMDELWNCGIRPSEGSGSAGSLKKTEDHLKDMRKIVSKQLGIEL